MAIRLTFKGSDLNLPTVCLVCQQPSVNAYKISRTFQYGSRGATLTLPVALCPRHFDLASKKNRKEQLVGRIGMIGGIVAGVAVAAGLLAYWAATQQGSPVANPALAAFMAVAVWLIVWIGLALFVAPSFADPEAKAARTTMRIFHYWPASKDIQVEFSSEAAADTMAEANKDRLLKRE
jgi:hypothetical protein